VNALYKNSLKNLREADKLRFVRLLSSSRNRLTADEVFKIIVSKGDSHFMSDYFYTKGLLLDSKSNKSESIGCYEKAINYNPYNFKAHRILISNYEYQGDTTKANELKTQIRNLKSTVPDGNIPE
jgi:tetratricopeptide (TPR) repeat protein